MSEGKLYKELVYLKPHSEIEAMIGSALRVNIGTVKNLLDEAKKEFVTQSISLKEAVIVLKDIDQTKIICFPIDLFKKWFGESP